MTQQHSYSLHEVGGRNSSVRSLSQQLLAVIWIDWYAYHVARFRALTAHPTLRHRVTGLELVGGAGVHGKLVFRSAEREGLPIQTLLPSEGWSPAAQKRLARLVWKKLNELKPAVVLVPGYYTWPALAALLWARLHGKKAVLMSESTRGDHPRRRLLEWAKGVFLTRTFQAVITGGKRQSAYMRELGFRDEQLAGLYDVVGNEYFAEQADYLRDRTSREEWCLPERYFVYVGRLAPEKNLGALLAAFFTYRERGGQLSLVLVGDGPEGQTLQQQAAALGISDCIHFAGLKNTLEIGPYYAFAEWFILPSWLDPWGLVVNEAMAAGLPVLVSDRCGCSDDLVEDGGNGFAFDPAQESSLLNTLIKTSRVSEAQRLRMARRSREIVSRYSPRLWAEEVVRIAGFSNYSKR